MGNPEKTSSQNQSSPWDSLQNRGTFVKGPDGKMIPKDQYDAAMEAYEREQFYKNNPGAAEHEALQAHLEAMDKNPDRLETFDGEHQRGSIDRNSEYMTIHSGKNGMYAGKITPQDRKRMARMMHDAEDLQTFEEDGRYADYIAKEREKIGTVYKSQDDFNHRIVVRLKRLSESTRVKTDSTSEDEPKSQPTAVVEETESQPTSVVEETEFRPTTVVEETKFQPPAVIENPEFQPPAVIENPEFQPPAVAGNKVKIGEINIDKVEAKIDEQKVERIRTLQRHLDHLRGDLAESYAKNRRIFVGAKNRLEFEKLKKEYNEVLNDFLRLETELDKEREDKDAGDKLNAEVDKRIADIKKALEEFVGDPNNSEKTQEEVDAERERLINEASADMGDRFRALQEAAAAKVNAKFINNLLDDANKLEAETIDKLDNGTAFRKFVSKVLKNKYLKGALAGAAIAGLAVTGVGAAVGLASGAMTIGLSYTAGGVLAGAAKGGFMGALMSRQDSKNSAIRGFANAENIENSLKNIKTNDENIENAASFLMEEYTKANRADALSNKKKTAISTLIGAGIGAFASGIKINNVEQYETEHQEMVRKEVPTEVTHETQVETGQEIVGYKQGSEIVYHEPSLENLNVPEGQGQSYVFEQLGGDPSRYGEWQQLEIELWDNGNGPYPGIVPNSNGVTEGFLGRVGDYAHTYPGNPADWPEYTQGWLDTMVEEATKRGLLGSTETITVNTTPIYQPVYDTIQTTSTEMVARWMPEIVKETITREVPNVPLNTLARVSSVLAGGAIGRGIGNIGERAAAEREIEAAERELEAINAEREAIIGRRNSGGDVENSNTATRSETSPVQLSNYLADFLRSRYIDRIGEEGVNILTSDEDIDDKQIERIWNALDDGAKRDVADEVNSLGISSSMGHSLRNWLVARNNNN